CEDIAGGPATQTYLVRDVVDYVDANYRTIPDRTARVIGGLSTGGYCAVNLTLRHQDVFSGLVSHSGYDRPDQNLYTGDLFGGNKEAERANTPRDYLPTIPITQPLGAYLDVGMGDNDSRTESAAMTEVLRRRGVAVTFHDFAGESHSWAAWRRNLFSSLPWVSSWFVSTGVATAPPSGDPTVLAAPPAGPPAGTSSGTAAGPPGGPTGAEAAPVADDAAAGPDANHIVPQEPAPAPSPPPAPPGRERHGPSTLGHETAARAGTGLTHRRTAHPPALEGQATRHRPTPAPARRAAP